MKWYFAVSVSSFARPERDWRSMILAAVRSARERTTLVPHLLLDGVDVDFSGQLRELGVTVINHRVRFYDALVSHAPHNLQYIAVASGAFLRVEIPEIEKDDDYIVYTDCDVMFLSDVGGLDEIRPRLFACAPQFDRADFKNINTGVMVMNVKNLRETLPEFEQFIANNLPSLPVFDQSAYIKFYAGQYEPLSELYNWKPYYGFSPDAKILHWHGPKPPETVEKLVRGERSDVPVLQNLFDMNPSAYRKYLEIWRGFATRP